jgi:plasmid replication initiation protein
MDKLKSMQEFDDVAPQDAISVSYRVLTYDIADLPLRDDRVTMERPFFSLAKRRTKPINYKSPDGKLWVKVSAHQDHGMATIWDADVLIWAASQIAEAQRQGRKPSRVLAFKAADLLRAIGRADPKTGAVPGTRYEELRAALKRLQSTVISTNIRVPKGNRERLMEAGFSWIDDWRYVTIQGDPDIIEIELSRWVFEGMVEAGQLLAIDPAYFGIDGGFERALYRIARKHCGRQETFRIGLDVLCDKTGTDAKLFEFRRKVKGITKRDALPGYHIAYDEGSDMVVFALRT